MAAITIGAYIFGLIILLSLMRALLLPVKLALRLSVSAFIGGLALIALNLAGGSYGLHISVNPVTAVVAGILGVPGIALIVASQAILQT